MVSRPATSPPASTSSSPSPQGKRINLPGGLPIIIDGHVIGGIGVGSGTGEQDRQVANAALAALPGARTFG
jgi:glc operon protein GlcG